MSFTHPGRVLRAKARLTESFLAGRQASRTDIPLISDSLHFLGLESAEFAARQATPMIPGVHAVGLGREFSEDTESAPRLRIYVSPRFVESSISEQVAFPAEVDGIKVDIVIAEPARIHQPPRCSVARRQRQRPVVGGISTGHFRISAGTISCFCRSRLAGERDLLLVLSNNHVFADVNTGQPGDPCCNRAPVTAVVQGTNLPSCCALHRSGLVAIEAILSMPPWVAYSIRKILKTSFVESVLSRVRKTVSKDSVFACMVERRVSVREELTTIPSMRWSGWTTGILLLLHVLRINCVSSRYREVRRSDLAATAVPWSSMQRSRSRQVCILLARKTEATPLQIPSGTCLTNLRSKSCNTPPHDATLQAWTSMILSLPNDGQVLSSWANPAYTEWA